MDKLPFRTYKTGLTDAQLVLLDAMFWGGALLSCLPDEVFREQWNLGYTHGLSGDELLRQLKWMCADGMLELVQCRGKAAVQMTVLGGELWSRERCPVWKRYCVERYTGGTQGRKIMSVTAVSPQIRDDFLAIWPVSSARRRTATINDYGFIGWRRFDKLFVGTALYQEHDDVSHFDERYWTDRELRRTWWGSVPELQRFLHGDAKF